MKKYIDKLMAKFGYYPEHRFTCNDIIPYPSWMDKYKPTICKIEHIGEIGVDYSVIPSHIQKKIQNDLSIELSRNCTFYEDTNYDGRQKFIAEIIILKPKK